MDKQKTVGEQLAEIAARQREQRQPMQVVTRRLPNQPELPPQEAEVPKDLRAALALIRNRDFLKTAKYSEQQHRAVKEGVHPDILEFSKLLVKRMGALGVPMFPHCMYRSIQAQNAEYVQGDSRAKGGQSPHNYGMAVDVIHSVHGWNIDKKCWLLIGHVGKELIAQKGYAIESLAWGGDWRFYDPAHWEIKSWKTQKEMYPWPKLIPLV